MHAISPVFRGFLNFLGANLGLGSPGEKF